ncbi:carboxypeptidase-like regulatory domain-containing protein [Sphingobacterium sp. DN00404]|uniref:Carboxypeptidase-like regulatory domain-containing protein n=1 Tax=Sphingobacterium micropteri TaxID=2763501 RepID=A0ABR7YKU6_9SPHI|nr:DUF5686 and carboxypeptidase-like regulatory domain-containing protein [Sphingobacterium micropteri]MBD1431884.1 carboxypeptidase-like regulatory domain-containing protein [Sphingobacterium micropteri]
MRRISLLKLLILIFTLGVAVQHVVAQQKISGTVVDDVTGKGVPQASIQVRETADGTSCDASGQFFLTTTSPFPLQLVVSAVGYKELIIRVDSLQQHLHIAMEGDKQLIDAVEISRRQKYRNRNPAVDLIHQVIKHKRSNRLENQPKLSFQQYDKLQFGLVNPSEQYNRRMGSLSFFFDNVDTLTSPGNKLLTIFMQEQLSDVYSKNDPKAFKKRVKSIKQTDFDDRYVNNHNIQSYLSYLFQDVEIYDENIFLINKLFLSPIANNAPVFYKYYIADTIDTDDGRLIELNFEPRNKTDLLLSGKLRITTDGRFAVQGATLRANKEANLNWVNDITIDLQFRPNAEGYMFLVRSDVDIMFGTNRSDAVYGRKTTHNFAYDFAPSFSDDVFKGAPTEVLKTAKDDEVLVQQQRPVPLSTVENKVYANVDSLNDNRTFRTMLAAGYLLAQGFYPAGPVEFGPLEYLYSRNNIEGNRIRLSGRTTLGFSDKVFIEGYLAYGTQDGEVKYFVRPTFSLNGKSVATFPAHYLQVAVQHDIFDPGRMLGFKKGDSFFQSIRSNRPTKWMDTYAYQLKHLIEFGNHVSLQSSFIHHRRRAIGDLQFISSGDEPYNIPNINTNELEFILRWAPKEKFYYRNLTRNTIIEKYPVFTLQYNRGLKGFWSGDYTFNAVRGSVSKRFFLNQLGFADMTWSGGKIWGTLPYPLLEMPNVFRDEDTRHEIDFSMMRSMEFVADAYIRLAFEHQLEGFILNKIPLIKKLKLREIWGGKMFYGRLSDANNPYISKDVVHFDTDADGHIMTHVFDNKVPYWEGKVGIDNIFRLLRVEYIRRLNYTGLPNVDKDRYRVSLHLNF